MTELEKYKAAFNEACKQLATYDTSNTQVAEKIMDKVERCLFTKLCDAAIQNGWRFNSHEDYVVIDTDQGIDAYVYEDGRAEYCVTGCYNSGCDDMEIDMKVLSKLKRTIDEVVKKVQKKN